LRRTQKYASFLRLCAPCLWRFLQSRPTFDTWPTFYESIKLRGVLAEKEGKPVHLLVIPSANVLGAIALTAV
jgi:hypothetical protein